MTANRKQIRKPATTVAAVFARGGSKGVPNKNLRLVGGKPLVVRAIEDAQACSELSRVIVSTDSEEIAEVAQRAGAEVPWLRPAALSRDTAREWDAWRHMLKWLEQRGELPELLVVVPCTAPLRQPQDIQRCIAAAQQSGVDIVITVSEAHRNPWFNMVTVDAGGQAKLVLEPQARIHRRQDAPRVYDVGTVAFVAKSRYVLDNDSLYDGVAKAIEVPVERALDVDSEIDLILANLLATRRDQQGADE